MKVLFLELVPNIWHIGEIKEVSDSYARNFLIPKWLAKRLSPQDEQRLIQEEKKQEKHRRDLVENRHKIVEKLNLQKIIYKANIWENNKMYGSIWEKDIIVEINKKFWIKLEKKHIDMWSEWHLKKLWSRDIFIKLSSDSIAKLTIIVE